MATKKVIKTDTEWNKKTDTTLIFNSDGSCDRFEY